MSAIELSFCAHQEEEDAHLPVMVTENVEDYDLPDVICHFHWSQFAFNNELRAKANFRSTNLFVMDVDDGLSLEDATVLLQPYKHIIATSKSHQKVKNQGKASEKPACDRFRVVLFLSAPIVDEPTYTATWFAMQDQFPFNDPATKDTARFYFKCQEVVSTRIADGQLVTPSVSSRAVTLPAVLPATQPISVPTQATGARGNLSVATKNFMAHGVASGFNAALYKAAKDYQQQGFSKQELIAAWNTAHPDPKGALHPLDAHDKATVASAFKTAPKHPARVAGGSSGGEDHPEVLTLDWLKRNEVTSICGRGYRINGQEYASDLLAGRCYFDIMTSNKRIRSGDVDKALSLWKHEEDKAYRKTIVSSLCFDPSVQGPWGELTELIKGQPDPLTTAILQHLVWQVKRKLNHLAVGHHMMPILYGKQGSGKTSLVERLAGPLKELFCKPQSLQVLSDCREATVFRDNALIFFDEMAQAARADVESIKNKITSKDVTYRILRTHEQATHPNIATMIGASNRPFNQLVFDSTGARRFFEIETVPVMPYNTIQRLDTLALWKSVDETQDTPILRHLAEISSIQHQNLRAPDVVEQFTDEELTFNKDHFTPTEQVYAAFRSWMETNAPNQHIPPRNRAIERIKELMFEAAPAGLYANSAEVKKKGKVWGLPCVIARSSHHVAGLLFTPAHRPTFAKAS
jgi:hypothetical protein